MSYGEKLSEISCLECAKRYIFERGLLAQKAKKENRQEWYKTTFIPFLQKKVKEAINEIFFGHYADALYFLHEQDNNEIHKNV